MPCRTTARFSTICWTCHRVAAIDGFLFVFPQYNRGYPAALKNALDFLYVEWRNKPASVFTYGTRGGGKGAQQLITVLHGLHMNVLEDHVDASLRTPTSTTSGSSPTPRPLCALPWSSFAGSTPGLSKCSWTASETWRPERPCPPQETSCWRRSRPEAAIAGGAGSFTSAHTASRDSPRTPAIAAIVGKAGAATRPDSIFRRVSGETPASSAVFSIGLSPRARRSIAPKRCPRSSSSGVCGSLTMAPIVIPG